MSNLECCAECGSFTDCDCKSKKNQEQRRENLSKACEFIKIFKAKNPLDNSLFIVTIGSDEHPATPYDIASTYGQFEMLLAGVKDVRVVISHNRMEVEQLKANGIIKAADQTMKKIYDQNVKES